ncbi:MAG: hypothetical protein OXU20_09500 [Myxococcales bacterium]|nr:hypothetical protein [Myxococcales bacterium]
MDRYKKRWKLAVTLVLLWAQACGSDAGPAPSGAAPEGTPAGTSMGAIGNSNPAGGPPATATSTPVDTAGAGAQTGPAVPAQAGPDLTPAGGDTENIAAPGEVNTPTQPATGGDPQTFCGVKQVLGNSCSNCHGATPAFGAPMPLVTHGDLMAASKSDGRPNYMVILDRVKDEVRPMPPTPNPMLEADQIAKLDAWVAAGTPNNEACEEVAPPTQNDPNCIDCGTYSCDPSKGTPLQILAHGQPTPGDTTAYDASSIGADGNPDFYQCFHFKAPWADGDVSLGHKPVIDNTRVLHHWLLYASDQAPATMSDGGMTGRCQAQGDPNRILLAGWAPGTPGINLPEGVGQKLPSGSRAYVTLEIHYYNSDPGKAADDRSGVELCMANEPQPHVATQHWLGTEKIAVAPGQSGTSADTCTPGLTANQTSTIISITPHMHKIGVHSTMEVLRADGSTETILDKAFQFDNQTTYMLDQPVVINAGDRLRTTCKYQNSKSVSVGYGEGSDEEMCYLFTTAYPAGSLHNGKTGCSLGLCIPGGVTRCIDNENILDGLGAL